MAQIILKIEGLEDLQKALLERQDKRPLQRIVKQNGAELQVLAQRNAQFRGHFEGKRFVRPTGNLKRSITGPHLTNGGLTAEVTPEAEYSAYVEYGTRFMDAQPYLRPAFDTQKQIFIKDLKKYLG